MDRNEVWHEGLAPPREKAASGYVRVTGIMNASLAVLKQRDGLDYFKLGMDLHVGNLQKWSWPNDVTRPCPLV